MDRSTLDERRGGWWVFGSFVFCPCHLPITLAALGWILGGSAVGLAVRDHPWIAAAVVAVAWLAGTAYGFVLLQRAKRGGACPMPVRRT